MRDKRNIAILGSRGIPARYGGYETVVEELSTRLVKKGIDVTVFCPKNKDYKSRVYNGVKLVFLPNLEKRFGVVGTLFYDFISILMCTFSKFNAIYMLGYSSALFCIIPSIFGKKIFINTDGLEWKRSKWSRLARRFLRFNEYLATKIADVLISDSMEIRKYFIGKYGCYPKYISYGTDSFYSKNSKFIDKYNIKKFGYYLIVARLEPENNIDMIVEGFINTNSDKKLVIIANIKKTKYFYDLQRLVESDKRVVFLGPVYDKNILNEIRSNAFAYIHGHSVGGTNPSLLESMACGDIVIAFDVPFNREVLRDNGYFFKDASEVKTSVDSLEKIKHAEFDKIRSSNRKTISKYYNWDKIIEPYFDLFNEI